jgi:hypothetical protein
LTSGPAACFNIKHAPNLRFDAAKTNSPVPNYPLLTSRSTPLPARERSGRVPTGSYGEA